MAMTVAFACMALPGVVTGIVITLFLAVRLFTLFASKIFRSLSPQGTD